MKNFLRSHCQKAAEHRQEPRAVRPQGPSFSHSTTPMGRGLGPLCSVPWPGSLVICRRQSCVSLEPATCISAGRRQTRHPCHDDRSAYLVLTGAILTAVPCLIMPAAAFFTYLPPPPTDPCWAGSPEHFREQQPSTDYILAFI